MLWVEQLFKVFPSKSAQSDGKWSCGTEDSRPFPKMFPKVTLQLDSNPLCFSPEACQHNRSAGEGRRDESRSDDEKTGSAGGAGGHPCLSWSCLSVMMKNDETVLPIHEYTWSHLQTCPSQVSCLVSAGSWLPHVVSLQVVQSARALQWIIDTLKSQDFAAKDAPTLSTWILSVYFHISTMTVSHKHIVSCRFHNRWGLWPNHQHYRERGPAPCERPTVSLRGRQSQTFPRSRGESPVGGISQRRWCVWVLVFHHISSSLFQVRFDIYQPKYLSSSDDWDRVDGSVVQNTFISNYIPSNLKFKKVW